jgi:hypothetical protein
MDVDLVISLAHAWRSVFVKFRSPDLAVDIATRGAGFLEEVQHFGYRSET